MKKKLFFTILTLTFVAFQLGITYAVPSGTASNTTSVASGSVSANNSSSTQPCAGGDFLGLPKWYAYLPGKTDPTSGQCLPQINSISDVWLIVAAVIEMLLRIAGLGAVIMVIIGGVRYTTSMGNPEAVRAAKNTITYSLIGLIIAVSAAFLVSFIAGSFGA